MLALQKVLVTGVYGLVGNVIYARLAGLAHRYDVYGYSRRACASDRIDKVVSVPDDHFFLGDLVDADALQRAVTGMDVVIHMAADPRGDHGWPSLLNSNLIGAYNVFEACRQAGVRRVLFASSAQVAFGYRDTEPYATLFKGRYDEVDPVGIPILTHKDVSRPSNLYGATKMWGEALAHVYAQQHGMSCIVLRIGWVLDDDRVPAAWGKTVWCSKRDIARIAQACVDAPPEVRFDVFYGLSHHSHHWLDIEHARRVLGYEPQDRI